MQVLYGKVNVKATGRLPKGETETTNGIENGVRGAKRTL